MVAGMVEHRTQNVLSQKCVDGNQAQVLELVQGVTQKNMGVAGSAVMT